MTNETDIALQKFYRDSLREATIRKLSRDHDWQRFRKIAETAERAERAEIEDYERSYGTRVNRERRELMRKAGAFTNDHPTPAGTDRFSKLRIDRQAQQNVRHQHANRLHAIVNEEVENLERLNADLRDRGRVKDLARNAFDRATDRRKGPEHRGPERSM